MVRIHPPQLRVGRENTSMVKRTSWLSPKEQIQVRVLVEVLAVIYIPGVWRKHAALRRRRFMQVRLLPGMLWPNPKWLRDPAVNRRCVGSTPTGHPEHSGVAQLVRASR